jgi:polygalacturonase
MKKIISSLLIIFGTASLSAQVEFKASVFGCMSDGITLNTQSIQTAINTISERGGGKLHFYVGRYLTGTVYLKNNVTIVLHEGATIVGVPSAYDYFATAGGSKAIIIAEGQSNIGVAGDLPERSSIPQNPVPEIIGMGVIQGQGAQVQKSIAVQREKGHLKGTEREHLPALVCFEGCTGVRLSGLDLQGAAGDVIVLNGCKDVTVSNHIVNSKEVSGSNGLVFSRCSGVSVTNNFFDVSGSPVRSSHNSEKVVCEGNKSPGGRLPKITN